MKMHSKTVVGASVLTIALLLASSSAWAANITGRVTTQGIRSPKNIVVYIDTISGKTFSAPAQPVTMNQAHLQFAPHVMVVLKGTTVEFKNDDAVQHNVFWPSVNRDKAEAHNMGTWPQGQEKPFKFNDLGVVPLLCNVHPDMSGYIVVVPTPYFAVTDKDGAYEIKDVPPGNYTLRAWSEDARQPTMQAVTLTAAGDKVNLVVKK